MKRAQALGAPELEVNLYLGHAYYGQSSYELAARHFERVAEGQTKDYLDILYHLSKSYSHLANKYFALLAGKFPESFFVRLARGHAFEIEKDWEKARIEYSEALKQNPEERPSKTKASLGRSAMRREGSADPRRTVTPCDEIIDGQLRFLYHPPTGDDLAKEFRLHQSRLRELMKQEDRVRQKILPTG